MADGVLSDLFEGVGAMFGFEIKREEDKNDLPAVTPHQEEDGAVIIPAGSNYTTGIDFDGTVRTEAELINKYRDMSLHPEIDDAIDNIVNEAIVTQEGEKTVAIVLDDLEELEDSIKKSIEKEFEEVLRLLEFNTKSYDVFRRWYIDGRLYYEVVINPQKLQDGVKELRYLDPRKVRKIRETQKKRDPNTPGTMLQKTVREYYLYSDRPLASNTKSLMPQSQTVAIKIAKDSVVHVTSGLSDTGQTMILSWLHKAIRNLNQLRAMEDAVVIYRIARAPERRVFYIDIGTLPKHKAEQHMKEMMTRHRNKLVYDSTTGEVRDERRIQTMMEDFWIARREGGKSTEIVTLPGGQNLGQMEDVEYFKRKLYKSLNVPISRMEPETIYNVGRSAEVSRDEIKFGKFIDRCRLKFSSLFLQILEKNLILKQIMTPEDWAEIQSEIKFRFLHDNYFSELASGEVFLDRMARLEQAVMYAGKYYSHEWIRKHILKQTDEDIDEFDEQIAEEALNPQYMGMAPGMGDDEDGMGDMAGPDQSMAGDFAGPEQGMIDGPNDMPGLPKPPNKKPSAPNTKPEGPKGAKSKFRRNKDHAAKGKSGGKSSRTSKR